MNVERLWKRFEKTGSVQAYLRFRQALGEAEDFFGQTVKAGSAKRNAPKTKILSKTR